MARTKETARKSTGGKVPRGVLSRGTPRRQPECYKLGYGKRHIPLLSYRRYSERRKCLQAASSKVIANFKRAKDFPHFVKLPREIQNMVWEMLAEEPRLVAVHTKTNSGLRSSIPPILHVCSESRAVGLKHYTLAFKAQRFTHEWTDTPEPGVYFNFERDTLYFRENWNENVEGAWCCLSQFTILVNKGDIERVRRVGLDVNARVCSLETSSQWCHHANFSFWNALEILYFGYENMRIESDCPITSSELESKDYKGFIERYKKNPCWEYLLGSLHDVKAVEWLRNKLPIGYHGVWEKPDGFLRKIELVSIKPL